MNRVSLALLILVLAAPAAWAHHNGYDSDPTDATYGTRVVAIGNINAAGVYPTNVTAAGVYPGNVSVAGVYPVSNGAYTSYVNAGAYNAGAYNAGVYNNGCTVAGGYYDARRGGVYVSNGSYGRGCGSYGRGYANGYARGYNQGFTDGRGSPYNGVNPWNGYVSANGYNGYHYRPQPAANRAAIRGVYGQYGPLAPSSVKKKK